MRPVLIIAIIGALAACAAPRQAFIPTERPTGLSPEGRTAAEYDIITRAGALGDARVWSRGAVQARVRGETRTLVHVGLELENNSARELYVDFDELRLDSVVIAGRVLRDLPPLQVRGVGRVQPGADGQLDVYFRMPRGVSPTDVEAFRVDWRVRSDEQLAYRQRTAFLPAVALAPFGPYYSRPYGLGYGWSLYPWRPFWYGGHFIYL
jgi:hypothetical protein